MSESKISMNESNTPSTSPLLPPPRSGEKGERPLNSKKDFETMVDFYLANNPFLKTRGRESELEIRFGTNTKVAKPLSKIEYDNVVRQFYNAGFVTEDSEGAHMLRIQNEYTHRRKGEVTISNIRAEIVGMDLIQEYCRTNNLQKILDMPSTTSAVGDKIKFTQKQFPIVGGRDDGKPLKPVDFPDFNFRVSYQYERDYTPRSDIARQILSSWNDSKKVFRYINRVRFMHSDYPVFLDVSIVKGSAKTNRDIPIPQYSIQDAKVFQSQAHYEVELEIDNTRVGPGTPYTNTASLLHAIRKTIRIVLSGIQGSNYPIAFSERDRTLQQYMLLLHGEEYAKDLVNKEGKFNRRILPRDFAGPSSNTLQLENIQPLPETGEPETNIPNIRKGYTVTDKADGERRLLYIGTTGRIYMIDTNMQVIFTGSFTRDKELYNSLIDGEYIPFGKDGSMIHLYAAFDVYYIRGKSVRENAFLPLTKEDEASKFRYPLLSEYIRKLKPVNIMNDHGGNSEMAKKGDESRTHACMFRVKTKDFYSSQNESIFQGANTILQKEKDQLFEYVIDGLIFTPFHTGVGGDRPNVTGPLYKHTWDMSFKWKPPKFNTIDFLVSLKKDKTGKDEIHNVFQEGTDLTSSQNILQYKTLVLHCGFDERKHGYINPMLDMINDTLPTVGNRDNEETYKPVAFQPTNPYAPDASLCNVSLTNNGDGAMVLMTEENEYFEENMIVEFYYDQTKTGPWRWVPLRVRYDKTNDLRAGGRNYGNAYHVANSNWHSIHNPITPEMISSGIDIPETTVGEDVYYNRSGTRTNTRPLRDFHNLYVKRKLILGVSNRDDTLIDYAVGKAGDLPKWLAANLKFVFGIDVSRDNIENHIDGACARYLNYRKKHRYMPGALFVTGNSGLVVDKKPQTIRSGKAFASEKDRQIAMAVFGQGAKDRDELGEGVYKRYGIGEEGFQISSCQFAMHYFFGDETSLYTFLQNVAECTKVNGYFTGTCYDGQAVFDLLKKKKRDESFSIYREDQKMYEITKKYDHTGFPEDENSLGYTVDVYQESINNTFSEYLVNFPFLIRVMENFGFTLITPEESKSMGLPNGSGLFSELYETMLSEVDRNPRKKTKYGEADKLTKEEKQISFLNRYFVFRKTHSVDASKVSKLLKQQMQEEDDEAADEIIERIEKQDDKIDKAEEKPKVHIIRKRKAKKGSEKITIE
jgi:hypothetical protein